MTFSDSTYARLVSALSNRYRIERQLGAGGMAVVYLAHDIKHDRDVAIKVLRQEIAEAVSTNRFVREIAITARLNHPHILPLLDSGEADGLLYYVMPVATGESLANRLTREGVLPAEDALRLASEVTEALAYAHAHGVIHRDIKPANVLLSDGHAIVADFGIAKALESVRSAAKLTMDGTSLGTPLYMAPEQATGESNVDQRADVYAVGVMLFEMVSGAPPFAGTWAQIMAEKLAKEAPSVATRSRAVSPAISRTIARCLERDAALRPQTAAALGVELRAIANTSNARQQSRGRTPILLGALSVIALASVTLLFAREKRARWVRETAIPDIARLVEIDQLDSAFAIAMQADARSPNDSLLDAQWPNISQSLEFLSEPSGAKVTRAALNDTTHWIAVGTTPTARMRVPNNAWFYRYEKPGYRPVTIISARLGGSFVPIPNPVGLRRVTDADSDMVLLRGAQTSGTLYGLPAGDRFDLAPFLTDKLEVTNRQYRLFVTEGGYGNRKYWDSTFTRNGKPITWNDAQALFVDRTGRAGPSTWEGGAPPEDALDLPVGGVSWYEARAYARFAGKELPTVYEWNAAAIPDAARWVVPHGRYDATGPVRGGAAAALGPRGVYDMAGNVREWTTNVREPGSRYILGGGWSDPAYVFADLSAQPEFDRSPINGIRLVRRLADSHDLARASAPIPRPARDASNLKPVDDATFRGLLALYDYDRSPLNATVERRDTSAADWIREDVSFDLPKQGERMLAVLFLPKRVKPPYQTIMIWPAGDVFFLRDRQHLSMSLVDYLVRGGRAVVYPIYEHTYGRGSPSIGDYAVPTIEHRDQTIRWATEMRRALDYASTRSDVDTTRLAYVGTSWGGRQAGIMLAVEPRFKTAVLNVAGLNAPAVRPEEDAVNFLPRVHIPVLMLSGKYDSVFPFESSQQPFLRLLGSPAGTKQQRLFEGGHFLPRTELVGESLNWLDRQLGPIARP